MPVFAGDIMVKYSDGSSVNNIIQFGQWFSKGSSKYTHAGLAVSATAIVEMDGHGLQEHDLTSQNAGIFYDVFHCRIPGVGQGAAETAKMMRGFSDQIEYSKSGAFTSISRSTGLATTDKINTLLDNLLTGGSEYYFCSGHVVLCYIVAMQQMDAMREGAFPTSKIQAVFGLDDVCYNPSYLHQHLKKSSYFDYMGKFKGAQCVQPNDVEMQEL